MNVPAGVWKSSDVHLMTQALTLDVPAERLLDKQQLLQALADSLAFPDYFGHNWDAAWDCLTGLDWHHGNTITLLLPLPSDLQIDADDLAVFLDLLAEAAEYWQEEQHQLALIVITKRDDLPCLADLGQLT